MFLWDNIGETRIHFDADGSDGADGVDGTDGTAGTDGAMPARDTDGLHSVERAGTGLAALLDACTVPIVMHDHARAGILGTATLLVCGGRHLLLTAAHLFHPATSSGNWLVPERASGQLLALERAQVHLVPGVDVAVIHLSRTPALPRLLRGRSAIPAQLALHARPLARRRKHRAATYCLAGYPAAWSRFERGYLAAKRLLITTMLTTQQRDNRAGAGNAEPATELRCVYGRNAERNDGQMIHTPALEGMSGAAIWEIERANGAAALHLAAVQSAFMHSRYLRGDAVHSFEAFLRA